MMRGPLGNGAEGSVGRASVGFPLGLSLLQPGCVLAGTIQRGEWGLDGEQAAWRGAWQVLHRTGQEAACGWVQEG